MSDFTVSPPLVHQTASGLAAVRVELEAELRALRRDADEVLTGCWRGAAATTFDRAWSRWEYGAREVVLALGELGDALDACGLSYAECDRDGSTGFAVVGL